MILIIGGRAQGKLEYVKKVHLAKQSEIAYCGELPRENIFDCRVVYGLQELVREMLERDENAAEFILTRLREEHIIICNEVGSGVVPMSRLDRDYREEVGRICCEIAAKSAVVERVVCGIAMRIKG